RHLLVICSIGAFGQVDGSHTAASDFADQLVPAQLPALHTGHCVHDGVGTPSLGAGKATAEPFGKALMRSEQTLDFFLEIVIEVALPIDKRFPSRGFDLQCRFVNSANSTKAFRCHKRTAS